MIAAAALLLTLMNGVRDTPVDPGAQLADYAVAQARIMAEDGAISHSDLALFGRFDAVGEIVGVGGDVEAVFSAFLDSPPHRRILLSDRWDKAGIGVVRSDGRTYVAVVFGDE